MIVRLPFAVGAARPLVCAAMAADHTTHPMDAHALRFTMARIESDHG